MVSCMVIVSRCLECCPYPSPYRRSRTSDWHAAPRNYPAEAYGLVQQIEDLFLDLGEAGYWTTLNCLVILFTSVQN